MHVWRKHRRTHTVPCVWKAAVLSIAVPGSCTRGPGSGNALCTGRRSVCVHSADCQRTCKQERGRQSTAVLAAVSVSNVQIN